MGRPLKIAKTNAAVSPDGITDEGYPNDGTTDNGFTTSAPGVVGGIEAVTVYGYAAVEQQQQGTIVASTATTTVSGFSTQFSDVLSVGSLLYANDVELGAVSVINASASNTVTATTASNDRLTVTDSSQFVVGGAVTVAGNMGNLIAGTVYYVYDLPTATTLRVSETPDLAAVFQLADDAVGPVGITQGDTVTLGAVSNGNASNVSYTSATSDRCWILRQKGKRKHLVVRNQNIEDEFMANGQAYYIVSVSNTNWEALGAGPDAGVGKLFTCTGANASLTTNGYGYAAGVCTLVNKASNALVRNEMTVTLDKASGGDPYCQSLTDHFAIDFTNNGTDENSGVKYIASFDDKTDTPDPATGLITIDIDYAC